MCFANDDYDWIAEVYHVATATCDVDRHCHECGDVIAGGAAHIQIWMQEHEQCRRCDDQECDCVDWEADDADDAHECKCEEPDYGETELYRRCLCCDQFLQAVEAAELEAGCDRHHSRPSLGNLVDEIASAGKEEAVKYFTTADRLFPALSHSGYLPELWARMFGEEP